MAGKKIRKGIAKALSFLMPKWQPQIEDWPKKTIVIGAPHTSNFDALLMVLIMWQAEREFNFLVKDEVIKVPVLKSLVRWLGGIPVNRRQSTGLTHNLAQVIQQSDTFTLCITPKGTRSKQEYWKSGFYRIAYENKLPITFGFVDSVTKTYGTGPTFEPTWNVADDMEKIRAFYKDMLGYNPEQSSTPRLRAEDDAKAAEYLLRPVTDEPMS